MKSLILVMLGISAAISIQTTTPITKQARLFTTTTSTTTQRHNSLKHLIVEKMSQDIDNMVCIGCFSCVMIHGP